MTIESSLSLEPYRDESGRVGFQEVHAGQINNYDQADWIKGGDNKLINELRMKAEISASLWKLPNRPDVNKYIQDFDTRYGSLNLEGPELLETKKEWIRGALTEIHTRLVRFFVRFIHVDDERMYSYLANLTIATYFRDQFKITPITVFNGVQGSGKTTVLNALRLVCYRAYLPSIYTSAGCIDIVNDHGATLLLDEGLNNLHAERGGDLYNMLLSAYNKETASKVRKNANGVTTDVLHYYTNIVLTTRGADMPEDIRSRSFVYTMGLPGPNTDLEDILYYEDVLFQPGDNPDEIRTDLYALKALTASEGEEDRGLRGMWLGPFREECRKNITSKDETNFQYGYIYNIPNAPRIMNRTRDLANVYYTIGLATESDEDMISLIIDNEKAIDTRNNETIEAVLFTALHDLIIDGYAELHPLGPPSACISEADLKKVCANISLKGIREGYAALRMDYEGWKEKEVEDSRTLTAKFRTMRIPYKPGAARINYLDPFDPSFMPSFKAALNNYCPRSERGIYSEIMNPKANPKTEGFEP